VHRDREGSNPVTNLNLNLHVVLMLCLSVIRYGVETVLKVIGFVKVQTCVMYCIHRSMVVTGAAI